MKWILFIVVVLLASAATLVSCSGTDSKSADPKNELSQAQQIVDKAIAAHGSEKLLNSTLEFDFRKYHYKVTRDGGAYRYERMFTDTAGQKIHDILTNDSFTRLVDGDEVDLTEKKADAYSNAVNSVIYFATLPLSLNDPAVQKDYLGEVSVQGEPYHKVRITFRQEGGGKDFQDEYMYWIHRDSHYIDYLAYNYETNGGGARFREAYNQRMIDGVRFQDYYNLKPVPKTLDVAVFDSLYEAGSLERLSVIDTENVSLSLR